MHSVIIDFSSLGNNKSSLSVILCIVCAANFFKKGKKSIDTMHPDGVRIAGIKTLLNHIMAFAATFNQKHPEKAFFFWFFG